tara:strand:+ start:3733 stop:5526 length:1794 start_codon:yes stop_codon:yes gene_type:complete
MNIEKKLKSAASSAINSIYNYDVKNEDIQIQSTSNEYDGYFTILLFSFSKKFNEDPGMIGKKIGNYFIEHEDFIEDFNVEKGFLNIDINKLSWLKLFYNISSDDNWGFKKDLGKELMVEFSSPNTNKPLHLGHLRNIFLGDSISRILKAVGYKVHKVQIINDRGIHICKSMIAWIKFGKGDSPEKSGMKGDHFVGKYYVLFQKELNRQIQKQIKKGKTEEEAEKNAEIFLEAKDLLIKWENRDPEVRKLWKLMNNWVYDGFDKTYKTLGVNFDKIYYESETYLYGKKEVEKGLNKNIFFQKEDNSIWVDLNKYGLDNKLLVRSDGTSVYITQDIGTAILRFRDFPKIEKQIYTVGNEQEYHFKVLFKILEIQGFDWAKECFHLSYGMIDLPSGKMKSREGTVVDADKLLKEMVHISEKRTKELGKINDFNKDEQKLLFEKIALSAVKYFLLKIDPKKSMLFDPDESIDFQGNTGPFIQYTYARIISILERSKNIGIKDDFDININVKDINEFEKKIIYLLSVFPDKISIAASEYSPSIIANYIYDLSKAYNRFYQEISIFKEEDSETIIFRISLSRTVSKVILNGMKLLGINMTNKM